MGTFNDHIAQAKRNLDILCHTNNTKNNAWDWQVTMSFYAAVHLVNAHIASAQNLHYRTHKQVKHALNPHKSIPIGTEFTEDLYKAYVKLQNLSRRSRYLCLDVDNPAEEETAYFTFDKHLKKAILQLDRLMHHMVTTYGVKFNSYEIDCIEIATSPLTYFKYVKGPLAA